MESIEVQEYMNHYPVTFTAKMAIEEASLHFLKTKQTAGPVIDDNGKLIGFLSESDVLAKMLETIYYNEQVANVEDLMSKDVLTVKPHYSVIELGQLMLKDKPKIYPVIDDNDKLLGIISRNDVLQAIDKHLRVNIKAGKEHAAH